MSSTFRFTTLFAAATVIAPVFAAPAVDLVAAARAQVGVTVSYDGSYQRLAYPGGDVPRDRGVCTDVVVRAYRGVGIDLQERVHQDMRANWTAYPHPASWGLKSTDTNIDHRRVPNLATFFRRHGTSIVPSNRAADYLPGDVVTWKLPGGLDHIGIVADRSSPAGTPLMVHNIGLGARLDDMLFGAPVTGHYRYLPAQ